MTRTNTLIIGGGQAGLAMSRCLTDRGIDHVILERGRVAERWRTERWDSLTLLTPNWQSRLPGFRYEGPDPDGYMSMPEVIGFLERYAGSFRAPIEPGTTVLGVRRADRGYVVATDRGAWESRHVVIATGYSDLPLVPAGASRLSPGIAQVTPTAYKNASQLPDAGVLVVGASASGIQLADEIHASGRPVTLAVGRHTRLPRVYRGRDILWWLDRMGILDETTDQVFDPTISRLQPALQLVGRPDRATLDLGILQRRGVRVVGRVTAIEDTTVRLADDLLGTTAAADVKLASLLQRIDAFIGHQGLDREAGEPEPFVPCWPAFASPAPSSLDLRSEGIASVVWATGFRRSYPWLKVPVLDPRGEIVHTGGVTPAPGLYVLGMQFQRRRKSSFIDGVGTDANELADDIEGEGRRRADAA
jgi:putative flavoprotein involved in K+ transport